MGKRLSDLTADDAEEITQEIDGKVWNCTVPESKTDEINAYYNVVNLHHSENSKVIVRIISDTKPFSDAVSAEPALKDLYMYHFQMRFLR